MTDAAPASHRPVVEAAEGFPVLAERDRDEEALAGRRRPRKPTSWLLTVFVLICVGYFLLPLFWLVVASTKSNADLFSSFGLWFANFNLFENIKDCADLPGRRLHLLGDQLSDLRRRECCWRLVPFDGCRLWVRQVRLSR